MTDDAPHEGSLHTAALSGPIRRVMPGGEKWERRYSRGVAGAMPRETVPPQGIRTCCLPFDDPADMTQKLDALAAGGKIAAGYVLRSTFGTVTDPFAR
jgi:hypothetical protein